MSGEDEMGKPCDECGSSTDADGLALYGCAWNAPSECGTCGACYCDGSC